MCSRSIFLSRYLLPIYRNNTARAYHFASARDIFECECPMNNLSCIFSHFSFFFIIIFIGDANSIQQQKKNNVQEHHSENVLGLGSQGMCSLDEQEQGLRSMQLGINPDDVEPILRKRQYVLQV